MQQKGFAPIMILVGILIIGVIAGGVYYFGKSSIRTPVSIPQKSIPLNQQSDQNTTLSYTIPILKDYDSKTFGRNLWLYNEDLKQAKQITFNREISQIFGLSPDKKVALVTTINRSQDNNDNNLHEKISIVDITNSTIRRLFPSYDQYASIWKAYWLDNNRIIYALDRQVKIYDILSSSEEILVDTQKSINDGTVLNFDVSPDKRWLVYYYSGGGEGGPSQQNLNTYSINLDTKKQTVLLSQSDRANYRALNNNFVIYRKSVDNTDSTNQIWKMDYSDTQKELIATLPKGELISILSNDSGSQLIYQLRFAPQNSAELYLYDLGTEQNKMFFKADASDGIREPKISIDGSSILFNAALNKTDPLQFSVVNYNLQADTQSILNNQEQSPHTVVVY